MFKTRRQKATDFARSGQSLVEFALVMPLLMVLVASLLELALLFNAYLGVNRESQDGAHLAAIAGPLEGSDCRILNQIETGIAPPLSRDRIRSVVIGRTTLNGEKYLQKQTWNRENSTYCDLSPDEKFTVPYSLVANPDLIPAYPESNRCPKLDGCGGTQKTVDNIGVSVTYHHRWVTPLNAIFDFFGGRDAGWTFEQRSIFRMEPTE